MLVVCSSNRKDELLKNNNNKLSDVKYMSKLEFIHRFYFDYDKKTIYELCKKYNVTYNNAMIYLDNLYYIDNKNYDVEKLDKLVSIKRYLDSNNLLIYDNLFREYLKNNEVVFDSCDLDKFDKIMISELESITKVIVKDKEYSEYIPKIIEFNTIDEEVEYVAIKICELINSGVSINKIKISGINDDYNNSIKRIFDMYNLKLSKSINLYSTSTVRMFISEYNSDISKTIELLKEKNMDHDTIDKIIDIVNSYNFVTDYNLVKDMIIEELKKLEKNIHYDNEIEVIDIMNNNIKDEYVFYLNYNQESIPKVIIDDDYITDDIRYLTKLDSISNINKKERINIKRALLGIKNLVITYKLKTPFATFNKANILDIDSIKGVIPTTYNYSYSSNKVNLTKMYDNLIKFGNIDDNLSLFNKHYPIKYNSYDNKYVSINTNSLYEYLDNKLNLSYTKLNDYYKCSFKYYLKYILKVDINKEIITRYIGSIFHYVLEKCLDSDLDIDSIINEYIELKDIKLSDKELFFLNKLKEELPYLINIIRKQNDYIILKKRKYEEAIEIKYHNKIDITFKGVIDKIIYDDDIIALVDYKTGNDSVDLSLNYYGINMQLAIYLLLVSSKYPESKFAGFYLQHILNKISKSEDASKKDIKYKLVGYSNTKYIDKFDKTYKDSSLIKGLKIKNDGTYYSTSKVLSDNEVSNLIKFAEEKVIECIDNIVAAKFDINPKNIGSKNVGCEYCCYKDICFMKNKDIIYLEGKKDFLGD